ncbi:MAG: hypothetical protein AAFV62_14465, partial [Pseudomonadota bacterium]
MRTEDGAFRFSVQDPAETASVSQVPASTTPMQDAMPDPTPEAETAFGAVAQIIEGLSGDRGALPALEKFREVEIRDATLFYRDEMSNEVWRAPHANITIERAESGLRAALSGAVFTPRERDRPLSLQLRGARAAGASHVDVSARFENVRAETLATQVPDLNFLTLYKGALAGEATGRIALSSGDLAGFDASLRMENGEFAFQAQDPAMPPTLVPVRQLAVSMAYDPQDDLINVAESTFDIAAVRGTGSATFRLLRKPDGTVARAIGGISARDVSWGAEGVFSQPLSLRRAETVLTLDTVRSFLTVDRLAAEIDELRIVGEGQVALVGDEPVGAFSARFGRFRAERLKDFWPLRAAPGARDWVEEHIQRGQIEQVTLDFGLGAPLPDGSTGETLGIEFDFSDLESTYVGEMTPITGARGTGQATLDRFDIAIDSGQVVLPGSGTIELGGSTFAIPTFEPKLPPAEILIKAAGP